MRQDMENIERQIVNQRNFDAPPLHLWHPDLCGDIDIRIARDGRWYHEGAAIEREAIVRLFASILRREEDGEYYLVTPAEKWRIQVELHPLLVTDVTAMEEGGSTALYAVLNTGTKVKIGGDHPLFLEAAVGDIAAVRIYHGLTALFSRSAWYRLVEEAEEWEGVLEVVSGSYRFPLHSPD